MSTGIVTASATGNTSAVRKKPEENYATITVYGTYGTMTFTVQASMDGTNFEEIAAVDNKTGLLVAGGTSIAPSDNTTRTYSLPLAQNYVAIRVNVGAIASGSCSFLVNALPMEGSPLFSSVAGAAGSFTNLTASGTLAVTGATTLGTSVTLNGAVPLVMSGTTGQPEIHLTDNLADALSVEISGSTTLLQFTTTDNAESVSPIGLRTRSTTAVAITGATTLTLADSGGIFTVSQAAAYDIDLPSPTTGPGCRYFFSLTAPGANNVTITVAGSAATFVGSIVSEGQIVVATGSTLTFATGASLLGDSIEIQSIATNLYHVRAIASALNGITVA